MAFYMSSDKLDDLLVKFVVLLDAATPRGLAEFDSGAKSIALVERLLSNPELMKRMLIADGAQAKPDPTRLRTRPFGEAMEIYEQILKKSSKSKSGILNRLALAIALGACPTRKTNQSSGLERRPRNRRPCESLPALREGLPGRRV